MPNRPFAWGAKLKDARVYRRSKNLGLSSYSSMVGHRRFQQHPTTIFDRILLVATIVVLPLQWKYPTVMGMSLGFIMFSASAAYLLIFRLRMFGKISAHPIFLAGYALVGIGIFMEIAHASTGYTEILRIALMILGASIVGALCRDRRGLHWAIYGFLLASVCMSALLMQDVYGELSSAKARDFEQASHLRENIFEGNQVGADANTMSFFSAQGVVVALVLGLMTRSFFLRCVFLAVGTFCLVATFLPMSRGGIVIVAVSCAAVLYVHGVMQLRIILAAGFLAVGLLVWVPDIVFTRMAISIDTRPGHKEEGRKRVYGAVIKHFPEYILTGVGISHYYGGWGRQTALWTNNKVTGTHNAFAQVTVYWGLAGLFALLALTWQAYRCLPTHCGTDQLRLCLLGIAITVMMQALFIHTLYTKEFSLALGLIAGSSLWIWPHHLVRSGSQSRRPTQPKLLIRQKVASVGVSFR